MDGDKKESSKQATKKEEARLQADLMTTGQFQAKAVCVRDGRHAGNDGTINEIK